MHARPRIPSDKHPTRHSHTPRRPRYTHTPTNKQQDTNKKTPTYTNPKTPQQRTNPKAPTQRHQRKDINTKTPTQRHQRKDTITKTPALTHRALTHTSLLRSVGTWCTHARMHLISYVHVPVCKWQRCAYDCEQPCSKRRVMSAFGRIRALLVRGIKTSCQLK